MNFIVVSISVGWLIRLVVNLLSYIHLWYIKEYRWDRMWIHLHTKEGKLILFPARRIPPLAPKTLTLFTSACAVAGFLLIVLPIPLFWRFLFVDLILFPITAVIVLVMKLPTFVYHEYVISRALRKFHSHSPMTVIGVTGSFGKTSIKEYLAAILGSKYDVLKTEASQNSPIGIAETISNNLKPDQSIFIVEMGAYKQGEIARMARLVQPEIGIVSAINAQHQDLFGSIEHTMRAKYELIAGLVGRRIAIINADNEYTRQMAVWAKRDGCTVWIYTKEKSQVESRLFIAENIQADLKGVSFDVVVGKERAHIAAPVLGKHQIGNILAAVAGAVACGMKLDEAAKSACAIRPFHQTLESIPAITGAMYINDTFNNNPDSAIAALRVLAFAKGRKTLIFQPMIELGSDARVSHKRVGEEAGNICDDIILTNHNFSKEFMTGVHIVNPNKEVSVLSPIQTAARVRENISKDDAVLFKGKEAGLALRLLL